MGCGSDPTLQVILSGLLWVPRPCTVQAMARVAGPATPGNEGATQHKAQPTQTHWELQSTGLGGAAAA